MTIVGPFVSFPAYVSNKTIMWLFLLLKSYTWPPSHNLSCQKNSNILDLSQYSNNPNPFHQNLNVNLHCNNDNQVSNQNLKLEKMISFI